MASLAENKKAYFDYEVLEKIEAGIVLTGQEVKSIKLGRINIRGSYVVSKEGEFYLIGATVPPYQPKNTPRDYEPQRPRKLLLKKSEINYLIGKSKQRGLTQIPLRMYTKQGKIKLEFAIAKGRKKSDKREVLKKRVAEREIERALRGKI
ncbi:MAG: SsrA-binding protein SmpB [Candidatus Nealsonbacteria bacterium]|nr:SsrA-binding protein SmpB [Candidatus Nealsonbacteria bacterium]